MAYDPKCQELAEHFLGIGGRGLAPTLAQHIQTAVEQWLEGTIVKKTHELFSRTECTFDCCPQPAACVAACRVPRKANDAQ